MLMDGSLTTTQASLSEGSATLVEHLQLHVWPLLGIKQDVAEALLAWVHFRQVQRPPHPVHFPLNMTGF